METETKIATIISNNSEEFYIYSKLGDGATCSCFKCTDKEGNKYAIKLYKKDYQKEYESEIKILKQLKKYKNVVQLYYYGECNIILENNYNNFLLQDFIYYDKINFAIFDLIENGELFDYIYKIKQGFPEDISKMIFNKIINTIEKFHNLNFCHCDIKPENILLDKNFKIKIIDFGFSQFFNQNNVNNNNNEQNNNNNNEINNNNNNDNNINNQNNNNEINNNDNNNNQNNDNNDNNNINTIIFDWRGTKIYSSPESRLCKIKGYDGIKK